MSVVRIGYSAGRVGMPGVSSLPPLQVETSAIQNIIAAVDPAISKYGAKAGGVEPALQRIKEDATAISNARKFSSKVKHALTFSSSGTKLNQAREKLFDAFSFTIHSIEHAGKAPVSNTSPHSTSPLDQPIYQPLHVAHLANFMLHAGRATILLQMQWKNILDMWNHLESEMREMNTIIESLMDRKVCPDQNVPAMLNEVVWMFDQVHHFPATKDPIKKQSSTSRTSRPPTSSVYLSYLVIEKHIESKLLVSGSALLGQNSIGVAL